jgi:hypothetical protein
MTTGIQQTLEGMLCYICSDITEEGEELCSGCQDNYICMCDACGDVGLNNNLLNGLQYRRAVESGAYILDFNSAADNDGLYCVDCIQHCPDCGEAYSNYDSASECCRSYGDGVINNYSYRPMFYYYRLVDGVVTPSFQLPDLLYMGVEIEINKLAPIAEEFIDGMSRESREFVYLKEDGSIGPDGAELVTMPATIDAFKKVFPFDELDWARNEGARSFYYSNCGFHIHVARSAFTATHMWKFVKFQLSNPVLCQRVAQREESSYATWYYDDSERRSLPEYVKGKKSNGRRYLAINFQNRYTVELRYFKGNILRSAIMKNLEFVQSIYDYTKMLNVRDVMLGALSQESYFDWLYECSGENYPNLMHFFDNNQNKESE